jgi:NPCBM/NEW2 domain
MPVFLSILAAAASLAVADPPAAGPAVGAPIPLALLVPDSVRQDYGALQVDQSVWGRPLQIGDRRFARGLGAHARGEIVFHLEEPCERFEAYVGVDAAMRAYKGSSVVFIVLGDGRELFRSGVMTADTPARRVSAPLAGVAELKLVVTDAGDGITCDHADWAEPVLVPGPVTRQPPKVARFTVISPSVTVHLTEDGEIVRVAAGRFDPSLGGATRLGGCHAVGTTEARPLPGGGLAFVRMMENAQKHRITVTERFTPTAGSVRWEVEVGGEGESWTTPVITRLSCGMPRDVRFWTAWSDPERRGDVWRDPLEPKPLVDRGWYYGNAAQTAPVGGDYIAIPIATLVSSDRRGGVSLVLSPDDTLLNMSLATTAGGQLRFTRTHHRLGGGRPVRFAMDLVGHEADWRGGLRWMVERYPRDFAPPNPRVHQMAGCAAYSGDERPIDADRLRRMAFRINWKLSDDFPYMGMFIPPVKDADERWTRSCDEPAPTGKGATTSCRQLNDYARRMRSQGFHVLSYFNVTEFGKNLKDAAVAPSRVGDPGLWKDPLAFLELRLPDAYLKPPIETCYGAWVVDVGDPAYRKFLLEQARRHIELLPDADGLCIDRLD